MSCKNNKIHHNITEEVGRNLSKTVNMTSGPSKISKLPHPDSIRTFFTNYKCYLCCIGYAARGQFDYSKLRDEPRRTSRGRTTEKKVTRPAPVRPPDPVMPQRDEAVLIDFGGPPPPAPASSAPRNRATSLMDEPIDVPEEGKHLNYILTQFFNMKSFQLLAEHALKRFIIIKGDRREMNISKMNITWIFHLKCNPHKCWVLLAIFN